MKSFKDFSSMYLTEGILQKILSAGVNVVLKGILKGIENKIFEYGTEVLSNGNTAVRYISDNGKMIRFQYNGKKIVAVDVWKSENKNWEKPTVTMETSGFDIIKLVPHIIDMIKSPTPKQVPITESVLLEAEKKLTIKPGEKIKTKDSDVIKIKDQTENVKFSDPKTIYKDLENIIEMLIDGIQYSVIVTGSAGQGKSYSVEKALKDNGLKEDKDYVVYKGQSTPKGLYEALFINNDKIIVFDDIDSILKDDVSVNILKAALDSKPVRKITWKSNQTFNSADYTYGEMVARYEDTGDLPDKFEYKGKVIFISNIHQKDFDKALLSRSIPIDVTLSPEDMLNRIEKILPNIKIESEQQPTMEDKKEVLSFMKKNAKKISKELHIRGFVQALKFKMKFKDWDRMALSYAVSGKE